MAESTLAPLYGRCVVDIASTPDADSTYISGGQVILASLTENLVSWNEASFSIQIENVDGVSPLLSALNLGEKPEVYFRFGIAGGDSAYWRPWEKYWLIDLRIEPTQSGIGSVVNFRIADLIFKLNQEYKIASRKGTISEIFTAICREHDIEPSVEPTTGKYNLLQTNITDYDFVLGRLVPRAANASQMGGYYMYQKDSKLCFTTMDYTGRGGVSTVWGIPYNTTDCFIEDLTLFDNSRLMYSVGGAGVRSISTSPIGEKTPDVLSVGDNALKLSNIQGQVSSQSVQNIGRHVLEKTSYDPMFIPQSVYAEKRINFYQMTFRIAQTSLLQVRDFLNFDMLDSTWSGLWVVKELRHEIDNGHLTTIVVAIRGETNFKKLNSVYVADASGKQLANTLEAKGKSPRIVTAATDGATIKSIVGPNG